MQKSGLKTDGKEPKRRQRKPKDYDVAEQREAILSEIYTNDAAAHPESLQKIKQSRQSRLPKVLGIILIVLLLLVGAAAAGFLTFNRSNRFNEKSVTLSFDAPGSLTSGGDSTVTFTVTNSESVAIQNIELSVSAPNGWTYKRSSPEPADADHAVWRLGTLQPGSKRSVQITGTIVGEVGSGTPSFKASASYRPANFNYTFSTPQSSYPVTIGSSIFELRLDGPTQLAPETKGTFTLTYTNSSQDTLQNIQLTATFPNGFTMASPNPKPRQGNATWIVDELKSGGTGTITFDGSFTGTVNDEKELQFTGGLQRGAQLEKQVDVTHDVLLVDSRIQLTLTVDHQQKSSTATPGQRLAYELAYKNGSDVEIGNITLSASISGAYDPSTFGDDLGSKLTDGKVLWDAKALPDLAALKPGASGSVRFTVKVLSEPKPTAGAVGATVSVYGSATSSATSNDGSGNQIMKTDPLVTKITTLVTIRVDARYYDESSGQPGSGFLPPKAGSTSTYQIQWFLGNQVNDVTNLTVQTTVPSAVFWTGRNVSASAGNISFNPDTRVITWTISRLPKSAQNSALAVASFVVSITPTAPDVGTTPVLIGDVSVTATDTYTSTAVQARAESVTTDLTGGQLAPGKGAVVAQ